MAWTNIPPHLRRVGGFELTKKAVQIAGLTANDRVMDLGCGTGETVDFLREQLAMEAIGVDSDEHMLAKAHAPHLRHWDGGRLPFDQHSFDAVICECSFCLFPDQKGVLNNIGNMLKHNGKLIITDLYVENTIDIQQMMVDNGFRITYFEDCSDYLKPFYMNVIYEFGSLEAYCAAIADFSLMDSGNIGYYLLVGTVAGSPVKTTINR